MARRPSVLDETFHHEGRAGHASRRVAGARVGDELDHHRKRSLLRDLPLANIAFTAEAS
jgi:hypothetical protein